MKTQLTSHLQNMQLCDKSIVLQNYGNSRDKTCMFYLIIDQNFVLKHKHAI